MTPAINKYITLSDDQLEEHFSQFLIDSWSYSAVATFARNEKEFERRYIYREPSRSSATTVAGTAYHAALRLFFENLHNGVETTIVQMQERAYAEIDTVDANRWKLGKKTPTVADCITAATKTANDLITNFYKEQALYIDEVDEVLSVEQHLTSWIVVNGVDIPLPCHAVIDLVVRLRDGRIVIIDHKSKTAYTDESELAYTGAKQAITYVLTWESHYPDYPVDEVWYVENKHSQNKDKSPQLRKMAITLDVDTRRLYEAILYEPLRRMLQATTDPNYIYTINDADNLTDRAELYDFWARTLIADIDDFMYLPESKRHLITRRQRKIRDASAATISPKVIKSFRKNAATFISYELRDDMTNQEKIEHVLRMFNIMVKVPYTFGSYSSISYLLEIGAGVMIKNISAHALDIANAINVPSVRILPELTVYNGKSYLCVEAPHRSGDTLLWNEKYLDGHKIPLGLDNFGNTVVWNLNNHSTPHMLICGATGSGKSVCIKSTIEYARRAGVDRIIILDPKYEFIHSLHGDGIEVIADIDIIEQRMKELVAEMQARAKTGGSALTLIVFDEFADAVNSARSGRALDIKDEAGKVIGREKSLEENLKMLLQKGRSLGYRIIAATQRASTKVITGDAKVNFPVQVCFRVPKAVDSKVVLDEEGAETLAGRGDGLIKSPEYFGTVRFQGFYKP
ncbi:MAG: PD-(D/E)XK nuclease family protein [Muribaculaceae bacterium]|nr:PD-(D/E)XK nuclease family protein [Muribaculaceae bacterium]